MNLLSPATLAYLRRIDPRAAAALGRAGRTDPPRQLTRYAPRVVVDNRQALVVIMRELYGRGEPAGDEDVIEGEYEEWD